MSSPLSFRLARYLLQAGVLVFAAAWGQAQDPAGPALPSLGLPQIVAQIQLHAQAQTAELRHYQALRHYQVDYRSFSARMDAEVSYDAVQGKSFRIVSQGGSRLLCDKVLKRALESEVEASRDRGLTALSASNYRFQLTGSESVAGRPAYVLDAQPLTASKFLFRGKVWVDAADFAVVKMETEPARNPSFWISRTLIHYSGAKVDSFWLPRQVRTETKVRIGGTAVLTIDYGTYQVVPATLQAANF
jgi:outer membrane lipoprotein-sorting protein